MSNLNWVKVRMRKRSIMNKYWKQNHDYDFVKFLNLKQIDFIVWNCLTTIFIEIFRLKKVYSNCYFFFCFSIEFTSSPFVQMSFPIPNQFFEICNKYRISTTLFSRHGSKSMWFSLHFQQLHSFCMYRIDVAWKCKF